MGNVFHQFDDAFAGAALAGKQSDLSLIHGGLSVALASYQLDGSRITSSGRRGLLV
jgi:hypothetical protein